MDAVNSKSYSQIKGIYLNKFTPRQDVRELFGLKSTFQTTNDAVKLSIYKNSEYNENAEFRSFNEATEQDKKELAKTPGAFIDQTLQYNSYSRRTLSLSIITDEGDTINISSDAYENMSSYEFASTEYSKLGKMYQVHVNSDINVSANGEINQAESADFEAVLAKAKNILDLSVKVAAGEATEQDLSNAISELGNGGVDNNTLSSVNISIDVESATGQKEFETIQVNSPIVEEAYIEDIEQVQPNIGLQKDKKIQREINTETENSKYKNLITKYYQGLIDKIDVDSNSISENSSPDFLSRTYKQLLNLNLSVFKENTSLDGEAKIQKPVIQNTAEIE